MICAICGGTGGARLARGISFICDPASLTYICNVGDNIRLLGLPRSPVSVGWLYRDFCSHFVLDERDFAYTSHLEEMGYDVHLLKTDALTLERQVEFACDLLQLIEDLNSIGIEPRSREHSTRG
jgi:hypothetical protein